jgi:hypothetical protein
MEKLKLFSISKSIFIFCLIITIVSCKKKYDDKINETEIPASEIPLAVTRDETTEKPSYYFTVIVTEEPLKVHRNSSDETESIDWITRNYSTKIEEYFGSLDSETKMRMLDNQEDNLRQTHLNSLNASFSILSNEATVKIIRRDVLVFKTYEEASLARQKAINGEYSFSNNTASDNIVSDNSIEITNYDVSQNRAYFYSQPSSRFKRKAYVVFGETVYGKQKENGFVFVEYLSSSGIETTGWLLISDLN